MKRKASGLIAMLLAAVVALSACSGGSKPSTEPAQKQPEAPKAPAKTSIVYAQAGGVNNLDTRTITSEQVPVLADAIRRALTD